MRIDEIKWGSVKIGNKNFRDVKIFPNGYREWDWRETNLHHNTGISQLEVQELIENGAKKIVLSQGYEEALQIKEGLEEYLKEKNIEYWILKTDDAVKKYNELIDLGYENISGALIHSTC